MEKFDFCRDYKIEEIIDSELPLARKMEDLWTYFGTYLMTEIKEDVKEDIEAEMEAGDSAICRYCEYKEENEKLSII